MGKPKNSTINKHGVTSVTKSWGNVFEALGCGVSEAADLRFRAGMMIALRNYFEGQGWSQSTIGERLGIPQPRVSELVNGKINKVSSDKLIGYLGTLGFWLMPSYKHATAKKSGKFDCEVQLRVPPG